MHCVQWSGTCLFGAARMRRGEEGYKYKYTQLTQKPCRPCPFDGRPRGVTQCCDGATCAASTAGGQWKQKDGRGNVSSRLKTRHTREITSGVACDAARVYVWVRVCTCACMRVCMCMRAFCACVYLVYVLNVCVSCVLMRVCRAFTCVCVRVCRWVGGRPRGTEWKGGGRMQRLPSTRAGWSS